MTLFQSIARVIGIALLAVPISAAAAQIPAAPITPVFAPRWTDADRQALLAEIGRSKAEGLRPERYDTRPLQAGTAPIDSDAAADRVALALAHDYAEGIAPAAARRGWNIRRSPLDYRAWLDGALTRHDLSTSLRALLPQGRAYDGLRAALARCDTPAHCRTIRVNLERWRWLPRELGSHYVWVNAAAFRLDLVEQGQVLSSHRVIVGKPSTPTPILTTLILGVTVNPWWRVPQSIIAESVGALVRRRPAEAARRGYVATRNPDGGLSVSQRPGPTNALGLVKLDMPNASSIFIHDTPSRSLFDKDKRAFSHGCVRTQHPDFLAKILLAPDQEKIFDALLASGANQTLPLAAPVPAYIVYLTAEADINAVGGVVFYDDVYRRDPRIEAIFIP